MVVKDFHIGKMKTVVRVEANSNKTALGKGFKDGYADLPLTTRGFLEQLSGSRRLQSGEIVLESQWRLIMIFQTALENNLISSLRFVAENRFFTIDSWKQIDLRRFYYEFILNEDQQEL
jgi:hypothetical protein